MMNEDLKEIMEGLKNLEIDIQGLDGAMNIHEKHKEQHKLRMQNMQKLFEQLAKNPNMPNRLQFNGKRRSTIKVSDDEHDIEIKSIDDNRTLKVKDKNGNIVFEGPINTEDERAVIPPELQEKIDGINVQVQGKNVQLNFNIDVNK